MTSKVVGWPLVQRDELGEHAFLAVQDRLCRVSAKAGVIAAAGLSSGKDPAD